MPHVSQVAVRNALVSSLQRTEPPRFLSSVCALLLALMVIQGAILWKLGWLEPRVTNDTAGYRNFDWSGLHPALSSMRTPGYPLVLKICQPIGESAVPILQYVAFCAAVLIFCRGLAMFSGDSLRSGLAAAVLLGARVIPGYVNELATDILAVAVGIAATGQLFCYLAAGRTSTLISIGLLVAAAWLIRPAFLFLIAAVPMFAWLVRHSVHNTARNGRAGIRRLFLVVLIPLLSWCLLRYFVVGRFGVVSFGGFNLIGIAGQFLTDDDVTHLSPELQSIARLALERRNSDSLPAGKWDDLPASNYLRLEDRYDITIWHMFAPPSATEATTATEVNTQLRQLAQELIRLHPADYCNWIVKAIRQCLRKTLWDLADSLIGSVLLVALICSVLWKGLISRRPVNQESSSVTPPRFSTVTQMLFIVSLTWWFLNLCVVIPVCPPLGRFTDSAAVLLLCPLATALVDFLAGRRELQRQF